MIKVPAFPISPSAGSCDQLRSTSAAVTDTAGKPEPWQLAFQTIGDLAEAFDASTLAVMHTDARRLAGCGGPAAGAWGLLADALGAASLHLRSTNNDHRRAGRRSKGARPWTTDPFDRWFAACPSDHLTDLHRGA
jgi:hypothetical protein